MTGGVHELRFDARGYSPVIDVSELHDATLVVSGDFVATLELRMLTAFDRNASIATRTGSISAPGFFRIPEEATAVRVVLTQHVHGRPLAMIVGRPSKPTDT